MIVLVSKKCVSLGLKYQQIWRQKCQNQTEDSYVFTHVHVAVPFQCQGAGLAQSCGVQHSVQQVLSLIPSCLR